MIYYIMLHRLSYVSLHLWLMYHVEPYKTFIFFDILPLRRNKKMAPLTTVRGVRLKKTAWEAFNWTLLAPGFPTHPMQAWGAPSNKEAGGRFGFV